MRQLANADAQKPTLISSQMLKYSYINYEDLDFDDIEGATKWQATIQNVHEHAVASLHVGRNMRQSRPRAHDRQRLLR